MRTRRILGSVVVSFLVVALAVPAAADPPNTPPDAPFVDVFDAWNPCLGVMEEHTIVFTPFDHFHNNNIVFIDKDRHGWTESGYLMKGTYHLAAHANGNFKESFRDVFRHPDTNSMFHATLTIRFVGNAPVIEEFTLECKTGPTIPAS